MKIRLLIAGFFCALYGYTQTVTTADMPIVNDTIRVSISASALISQTTLDASAGTGQTWNLNTFVPDNQDLVYFANPASFGASYVLFNATSTYGVRDPNPVSLGSYGTATKLCTFYKNSTTGFYSTGKGLTFNGSDIPIQYSTGSDVLYSFPLTYLKADSSVFYGSTNMGVATISTGGKRVNHADATGTLITAKGTYSNCIRIKSVYTVVDSIKPAVGPATVFPRSYVEYTWLIGGGTPPVKIPLLTIRIPAGGGAAQITYQDINRPAVFKNFANFTFNKNQAIVNKNTDTIILSDASAHNPTSLQWTITPASYTVAGGSLTSPVVKILLNATTLYTVKLVANYTVGGFTIGTDDTTRTGLLLGMALPVAKLVGVYNGGKYGHPGDTIRFYDSSASVPAVTIWRWNFTPGSMHYIMGTDNTKPNPVVVFDSVGVYSVSLKVTNAVGSDSTTKSNYVYITILGVNEISFDETHYTVFPNPAKDYVAIGSDKTEVNKIEISDMNGRAVEIPVSRIDKGMLRADCSTLSRGIYLVKIYASDQRFVVKKLSIE